jgi:hypothetical protein
MAKKKGEYKPKIMTTNYRDAWETFVRSDEYNRAASVMLRKGMQEPYIKNVLRIAFEAGWGEKKIEAYQQ